MRRGLSMVAAAFLLALLPLTFSGCIIACGCASTPDPNWTPQPITSGEAAISAAKFAGYAGTSGDVPGMTVAFTTGPAGRSSYIASAPNTLALVDAASDTVLEVVLEDRMPNDAAVSATAAAARATAEAYLGRIGMSLDGLAESARLIQEGGVAAYAVQWNQVGGVKDPRFEVLVNAVTGALFAFVDQGILLDITAPVIGPGRASELAVSAFGVPGATVTSVELRFDFSTGSQVSAWDVALGGPIATDSTASAAGGLVDVNAVSGVARVVES